MNFSLEKRDELMHKVIERYNTLHFSAILSITRNINRAEGNR